MVTKYNLDIYFQIKKQNSSFQINDQFQRNELKNLCEGVLKIADNKFDLIFDKN